MLKRLRTVLAIIVIVCLTSLFLDYTGSLRPWLSWLAKIQLVPAVLSLNLIVVAVLLAITLLFGRIYCSVICPLGIMQDVFTHVRGWIKIKKKKKNRFFFTPDRWLTRVVILVLFIICLAIPFTHSIATLIEPYSAYGRIATSLLAPVYDAGADIAADIAYHKGDYIFAPTLRSPGALVTAVAWTTLILVGLTAFFSGRTYCNTVCPVGTLLGYVSKFSLMKPHIDVSKCNGCTKCARNCKASCIDPKAHKIDYSRCVACMDCIEKCSTGAISYGIPKRNHEKTSSGSPADPTRRAAIMGGVIVASAIAANGAEKRMAVARSVHNKLTDGGLAPITPKQSLQNQGHIVPAGAKSLRHFSSHCTACQLCVSACPNSVLKPSSDFDSLMQPHITFNEGYCRPECVACSKVCPAGAISMITPEEKTVISIGHAHVDLTQCLSATDVAECGNCARHCPTGAISMAPADGDSENSPLMPVVNESACLGCGSCEYHCPVRPVSAINVKANPDHLPVNRITRPLI